MALNNDFKIKNGLTVTTTVSAGGIVEADGFCKHDGTSSQFLKANGSVDTNSYLKDTTDTFIGTLTVTGDVEVGGGDISVYEGQKVILDKDGDGFADIFYDANDTANVIYNSVNEHHFKNGETDEYAPVKADTITTTGQMISAGVNIDQLFGSGGGGGGDITEVIAGTGLTGGGTTGSVTLNLSAGDGVQATANCVSVDSSVARTTIDERFELDVTVNGDLSAVGATYTDCLVVGGSVLDGTTGSTLNGDFVVQASSGQDYLKVTAGNVCFNTGGGTTQMGSANLGARVNIQAISDAVPTLSIRGKSGSSDLVRVSSALCTNGDYFNINNDGKVGIGTDAPEKLFHVDGDSLTSGTAVVTTLSAARICSNDIYSNTAFGNNALNSVTSGCHNVAIGLCSSYNHTTGAKNVTIGDNSSHGNTTGSYNVTIGSQAGFYALSGDHNMALGQYALYDNWGGDYNTAIGAASMQCNTTGSNNAALGYRSMMNNTTGNDNFAVGECALQSNVNGIGNTALGQNALGNSVTGNYSVAIGSMAGAYQTNGCTTLSAASDSIYIGRNTKGKDNNDNNSIVIGYNACSCGQNSIKIGNSSITAACVQVAWTAVSDERDKTDITDLNHGLEFIGDLKPKAFKYRRTRTSSSNDGICRYGFLAQDIQGTEDGAKVIVSESNPEQLGLNSDYLVPILVKAVQELEARVQELEG